MFVFQDVVWITIRDVHLKFPTIAVVWGGEDSPMFPSQGSVLSAHHLLSSPPVPLMSLYWYGLLSVYYPLAWEIWGMLWYQCQTRRTCWEGDTASVLMTLFPQVSVIGWSLYHQISNSFEFAFFPELHKTEKYVKLHMVIRPEQCEFMW